MKKLLAFLQKYPSRWHSFKNDYETRKAVRAVQNKSIMVQVNWETNQIKFH